jgi:hypothetical protein
MPPSTLWEVVNRRLSYRSEENTNYTTSTTVTLPGRTALDVPESWRADRCIKDNDLLDNLIEYCRSQLNSIPPTSETVNTYDYALPLRAPPPMNVDGETAVNGHLAERRLPAVRSIINGYLEAKGISKPFRFLAEQTDSQIPDFIGQYDHFVSVIIEAKSETIARELFSILVERAEQGYAINWTDGSAGSNAANLMLKVCAGCDRHLAKSQFSL